MIKFNRHNVTDSATGLQARIFYSLDNHVSGRPCVTLYAKDYRNSLAGMFEDYENNTDARVDYFEKGRVRLFQEHPLYAAARAQAEKGGK